MKVAISGAGVAGTALAYWLHRTGHTPTLIEQAPAFRTGGYMIDFWGVGYRVAKKMGIEDQLLDAGYEIQQLRSVDSDGKVKAELPVEAIRNLIGHDFTSLPRGDLAATVYRTVADKVETVFGDTITAVDDHGDGVRLTFGNAEPREFDLLVGADGLHSNVRRLAFGTGPEVERYLGCKVAACVVDGYRPRDELVYLTYNTLGRQAGRVALREDRTLFLFIFRAERTDAGPSRKTSCARSSATPAGNARRCSTRSTTPTTCTSMWSARSRWITGRVAGWGSSGTPRAASHCLAARAPAWR